MGQRKEKAEFQYTVQAKDLPATQGMLHLVRNELKSEMKSGFKQVDARFNQLEARFNRIDARFNQNDSKFSQIDARFNQNDSKFSQIDARFNQIDARFNEIDARFNLVDARFDRLESKLELVLSEVSRIGVLVEEQHSKNRVTLEGLTGLWQRQERIETRVDEFENWVKSLRRS